MILGQTINLVPLQTNNGLLPIKLGSARIMQGYQRLLHVIQLNPYSQIIQQLEQQTNHLSEIISSKNNFKYILNDKREITQQKLRILQETFKFLLPTRSKRGLINGLGSLIKDLTGNLDNQDLIDIQKALTEIHSNQDSLNKQINDQIHINAQMIHRLTEIQNYTTANINRLHYEINKTITVVDSTASIILFDQHFFKINHIIDQLNHHLKDISEIIQLSRHQIISRHLLNPDEINYILKIFQTNNIQFANDNDVYNLIALKGYYNHTNIIFSIEIPNFTDEKFNYYKIKVIPNLNKIIQPIPSFEIITNAQNFQFITKTCKNIDNQYFCEYNLSKATLGSCIPAIIMQLPANCLFQEISPIEDIDYISYGQLYVQPNTPIPFTSNCNQNTMEITKQTLIQFSNCTITMQNTTFSTEDEIIKEKYTIHIPYNRISVISIRPEIKLEKLHNNTIQNIQEIQLLHRHQTLHSSTGHISLTIIIIIILIFSLFKIFQFRRTKLNISEKSVPIPLLRTNTILRREESHPVTDATRKSTDAAQKSHPVAEGPFSLLKDGRT